MPSAATRARVARAAGDLGAAAVQQMETDHEWYRSLSAENRSWVGLVAQAGITSFLDWFGGDADPAGRHRRRVRHRPARADPVDLAGPDPRPDPHRHRRRRARHRRPGGARARATSPARPCCATAARSRSPRPRSTPRPPRRAVRGTPGWSRSSSTPSSAARPTSRCSRARAALGWGAVTQVRRRGRAPPPPGADGSVLADLHRAARRTGVELLVAIHGPADHLHRRQRHRPDGPGDAPSTRTSVTGPLVVGPVVPHLFAAGRSARAAISGHGAAPAWPARPPAGARRRPAAPSGRCSATCPHAARSSRRIVRAARREPRRHAARDAVAYLDGALGSRAPPAR